MMTFSGNHGWGRHIFQFATKYGSLLVVALACLFGVLAVFQVQDLEREIIDSSALRAAQLRAETISEMRSLYTSEVVARVRSSGIAITHDYEDRDAAIPLPATLSMLLGEKISRSDDGARVQLISPYPFPWRSDTGGLRTEFARLAWETFGQGEQDFYYRFEERDGVPILRYAIADRMMENCVDCHNSHPETPRTGWQVGDLRGILEIDFPIADIVASTSHQLWGTYISISVLFLLTVSGILITARRFENSQNNLAKRSAELISLNASLDKKVSERTAQLSSEIELRHADAEALQSAGNRLRAVIDLMPDAVIVANQDGEIQSFNRAASIIFGYAEHEIIGQNLENLMPDPNRSAHREYVNRYVTTRAPHIVGNKRSQEGLQGRRKNGEIISVSLLVDKFEVGGKLYFSGMIRDLTADLELKSRADRLLMAVEGAHDAIVITDSEGQFEYVNPAFEEMSGYRAEEVVGKSHTSLLRSGEHDDDFYENLWRTIKSGAIWSGKIRNRKKDGTIYDERQTISPLIDEVSGEITGYVSIKRDISEQLIIGRQLAQAQKLESIGQLAAGIAHEINTPAQFIGDNVVFLQRAFGSFADALQGSARLLEATRQGVIGSEDIERFEETLKKAKIGYLQEQVPLAIEQTLDGLDRVRTIVSAMKDFSHPGVDKTAVDLNRAIESTITVSRNEWKYVAEMVPDLDPDLPPVVCLPGHMNQVILNLITNAAHAIGDVVGDTGGKGSITVSTRSVAGSAEIRVSDTGTGIPDDIKTRIFEAFFTTKDVGKGTGQGLALVHDVIVIKHGGTVNVESKPGDGTTFIIRIPLRRPSDEVREEAA